MMVEGRDKGIIQRVVDQIYAKFAERSDLQGNCEIKVSFLEIYKENVTDLLEGHTQDPKNSTKKSVSPKRATVEKESLGRDRSSSFVI